MTLFPDMVRQGVTQGILYRAMEAGYLHLFTYQIRDYSADKKHHSVDDYTYGGGAGMLMQAQPIYDCFLEVRRQVEEGKGQRKPRVIYVTPQGQLFTQQAARELAKEDNLIFLCGHYEGVDERVIEEIGAEPYSIGDYVLTGGELASMVMIDAIARLVPGVLHNEDSAVDESFTDGLLEEDAGAGDSPFRRPWACGCLASFGIGTENEGETTGALCAVDAGTSGLWQTEEEKEEQEEGRRRRCH